jgi:hypothetical protein
MPSIITPKRRRLTRSASKVIDDTVDAWRRAEWYPSINTGISLGIRSGALRDHLRRLTVENDALPSGVVRVPARPYSTFLPSVTAFSVNLEDLRQGPPDLRDKKR